MGQALVSRVPGTILMGAGALAYIAGATLLIFIRQNISYWALLFPSLCITVMGADFQFIAANVSFEVVFTLPKLTKANQLYINTQMPDQASLGAGVLQTAMRLSISLGLAITAAVYGTTSHSQRGMNDIDFPFERAYLCTIMSAVIGFLFIPFMRIGKQDGKQEPEKVNVTVCERPRVDGQYADRNSGNHRVGPQHHYGGHQAPCSFGGSSLIVNTKATNGSQVKYFPRWSWEDKHLWNDRSPRESKIMHEVCIKCLEERRVVVQDSGNYERTGQQLPGQKCLRRRHEEEMQTWTPSPSERIQARGGVEVEVDQRWIRLPDEGAQMRHQPEDIDRRSNHLPNERITWPRCQSERAWQRFPVKPSMRDVERGDVPKGDGGWL